MTDQKDKINPNSKLIQFIIIAMICAMPTGSYFGMDSPAPIEKYLKESISSMEDLDPEKCPDGVDENNPDCTGYMSHSEYTRLYTIYSLPNVVICFVSGYLIDSVFGRRKGSLVFAGIVTLGAGIVAMGAYQNSLLMMYVGRFVFGSGSESLALCEYAYNIHWFDTQKLANEPKYKPVIGLSLMFGIAISISRGATWGAFKVLGGAFEYFAGIDEAATAEYQNQTITWNSENAYCDGCTETPLDESRSIYNADNQAAGKTLMIAFVYAGICFVNCIALGWLDIRGTRWRKANKVDAVAGTELEALNNEDKIENPTLTAATPANNDDDEEAGGFITLEDIKTLPIQGWYVFIICTCFYATIFPFVSQGVEFLKIYRGMTDDNLARSYTSWILVLSGLGIAPAFGFCIDKFRYNTVWLGSGVAAAGLGHFALTYSEIEISFIVIFMGLGYAAVAASLWPLLSYNVPKKISGTSYGLMQSFQLGGLMLMYEVSGYLMDANADDKRQGYRLIENIYIFSNIIAFTCTVLLAMKVGIHGGATAN